MSKIRSERTIRPSLISNSCADIEAPTLIAHGTHEAIVPLDHATAAAEAISGAELILVEEGHHMLSSSRSYRQVARRQLELAHR